MREAIDSDMDYESITGSSLPILIFPRPHTQTNIVEYDGNYFAKPRIR